MRGGKERFKGEQRGKKRRLLDVLLVRRMLDLFTLVAEIRAPICLMALIICDGGGGGGEIG
jgi:hypothetical protein